MSRQQRIQKRKATSRKIRDEYAEGVHEDRMYRADKATKRARKVRREAEEFLNRTA